MKSYTMKKNHLYRFALALAISGAVVACSKNNKSSSSDSSSDLQTQSSDQTQVSNENDAIFSDVELSLASQYNFNASATVNGHVTSFGAGRDTLKSVVCDASVVAIFGNNTDSLILTYNGSDNCSFGRIRKGTAIVTWAANSNWSEQGATLTVTIKDLKITRSSDGKSITLNGTHVYTNTSGGDLMSLMYSDVQSVTHTVTSDNMSITFDNGSTRTWSVARQRVYTYNDGYVATTSGLHTDGSTTGISEWGTNRFGNSFETVIDPNNPLVLTQNCYYRLTSGQISIIRPAVTTTITFGLDASGNPTSCPAEDASFYFKLVYEGSGGKSYTFILPY